MLRLESGANPFAGTGADSGGTDRFTPADFKASLADDSLTDLFLPAANYRLPVSGRFAVNMIAP